jgi:DNA-binding winged helix-turn-helix (wHTH) protein/tetratricopeptide (TPR) repeat protein
MSEPVPSASAGDRERPTSLLIGPWTVDPALDELRRGDEVVKLEPRKMQLLLALAARPGQLVTTDELFATVWKDVVVTQSSIYQSVALLRRTLGDDTDEPRYIATVPRKGYRLVAPVRWEPDAAMAPAAPPPPEADPESPAAHAGTLAPQWRRRLLLGGGAAGLTLAFGLAALQWHRARPRPADDIVRIAVLPFSDLSPGGVEAPLAEELADQVAATLARHPQLRVAARGSMLKVRSTAPRELAAALDVSHLITGELYRAGGKERLTTRLLAAGRSDPLWFEVIERPAADLGAMPSLVAAGALRALRLAGPAGLPVATPQAYELTLLGHHALRPMTLDAVLKARDYYQRAIDVDSRHAPAYAGLAHSWVLESQIGRVLYPRDAAVRAQPLLDKAFALDPDLVDAHVAAGHLAVDLLQPQRARQHLERAAQLQPGRATAWSLLAQAAQADGRMPEAAAHYARAIELDPLNFQPHVQLGLVSTHTARHDEALAHFGRARQLEPAHPNPRWGAGIVGYARGRIDDAVRGHRDALAADSRRRDLWFELGWLYLDLSLADAADDAFEQATALSRVKAYGPLNAAYVLFLRGQADQLPGYLRRHGLPSGTYGHMHVNCALILAAAGDAQPARPWLHDGVAQLQGDPIPAYGPWDAFRGYFPPVDIAAVYMALGDMAAAAPFLDEAQRFLDHHEHGGAKWHAAAYQRARILALRGQPEPALRQLEQAVAQGWRRAWWARVDPALASLRHMGGFSAPLDRVQAEMAGQRRSLTAA